MVLTFSDVVAERMAPSTLAYTICRFNNGNITYVEDISASRVLGNGMMETVFSLALYYFEFSEIRHIMQSQVQNEP